MSIIDENLARIFLQATPLRNAVLPTIDFLSIIKRVEEFEFFTKPFTKKFVQEFQNPEFLKKEILWSLSKCNEYLEFLLPEKSEFDCQQIESHNTIKVIIEKYKQAVFRLYCFIKKE